MDWFNAGITLHPHFDLGTQLFQLINIKWWTDLSALAGLPNLASPVPQRAVISPSGHVRSERSASWSSTIRTARSRTPDHASDCST